MINILKSITEKKVGFKIKNYNNCTRLSEIIYIETGLELNYNTLRRLFGIVKSVKPSNYTLNTLSKFNGYESYNDFIINFHLKNRWKEEFEIVNLMQEDQSNDLIDYISTHIHTKRSFILKLTQIIRELMIAQNFDVLRNVFALEKMKLSTFNYDDVAYIGNCVGPLLSKVDIKSKKCKSLILNENFQDIIITIYVDYYKLSDYYGEILSHILKHTKRDAMKAFCKGVLNLNLFFEFRTENKFYKPKIKPEFHPILKSRVMAQVLFLKNSNHLKLLEDYYNKILENDKTNTDYFFEIIFTSIITRNFEVMQWIINKFKYLPEYMSAYKYEHHEHFTLMSIIYYQYIGDKERCELWLKFISFNNFVRSYEKISSIYYAIFKYHFYNKNKTKTLNQYLEKRNNIYPKFFTEDYLLDYFN